MRRPPVAAAQGVRDGRHPLPSRPRVFVTASPTQSLKYPNIFLFLRTRPVCLMPSDGSRCQLSKTNYALLRFVVAYVTSDVSGICSPDEGIVGGIILMLYTYPALFVCFEAFSFGLTTTCYHGESAATSTHTRVDVSNTMLR